MASLDYLLASSSPHPLASVSFFAVASGVSGLPKNASNCSQSSAEALHHNNANLADQATESLHSSDGG